MAELEKEREEKHKAISERERSEKDLKESTNKMKEIEVVLKDVQEKVTILEENKTYLLNENTILKNEAKVASQKKKSGEGQNSQPQDIKSADGQEMLSATTMSKELISLQKELKRFKKFTFRRLDELAGISGSSSSSSLSSCGDEESGEEDEEAKEPPTKHKPSPKQSKNPVKHHQESPPWVLRYESNNQPTAALSPDESGRKIPLVPGEQSYSDKVRGSTASPKGSDFDEAEKAKKIEGIRERRKARESKTLIFSSSITRDISRQQRSFNEKYKKGNVSFHEFKGKRARDIVKYMVPHLEEEQPSAVVFVAGGNDLPNKDISIEEIQKTASCLVEGGLVCREEYGVSEVYISSIMPRAHSDFQGNRHRLNKILRDMCKEFNFNFIDHDNIVLRTHGHQDGVHLNCDGSDLLRDNLLNVLNS